MTTTTPRRIIGLAGYAQVGKDTAAAYLETQGWTRYAFADSLKGDLATLVRQHLGLDIWAAQGETKEKLRPLMVAWGAVCRAFDKDFWVKRLFVDLPATGRFVISDVRYLNEIRAIQAAGGVVINICRPGYGPANEEEHRSFQTICIADPPGPFWATVVNRGSIEELYECIQCVLDCLNWADKEERAS